MSCIGYLLSGHREGHQRDRPRPLDGDGDLALVLGAIARDATRDDLAAIRDEVLEGRWILVIDGDVLVGAEAAHLAAREATLAGGAQRGGQLAGVPGLAGATGATAPAILGLVVRNGLRHGLGLR